MFMRLIVAGSRTLKSDRFYKFLENKLDYLLQNYKPADVEIVSGCASGVDSLAIKYAKSRDMLVAEFPAEWDNITASPCHIKYSAKGKAYNALAGHNRNRKMAEYATHLVAFTTGSRGTQNMIDVAVELGLVVRVYSLQPQE
jgi:hypothetical protein